MGDPSESLKYGIDALKIFEEIQDTFALLKTYMVIGNSYLNSGNLEESIGVWKEGLPAAKFFDMHYYSLYLDNIAGCYNGKSLPDSAMPYVQEALRIGYKRKDSVEIAGCLAEMGNTFIAIGQNEMARTFYRQSISFQKKISNFYYMFKVGLAGNLNGISQSFYNPKCGSVEVWKCGVIDKSNTFHSHNCIPHCHTSIFHTPIFSLDLEYKNYKVPGKNTFDAIVIGSGISGGWAAKELCEHGLKTLVLERGRNIEHIKDYPTATMNPWDFPHRGNNDGRNIKRESGDQQMLCIHAKTRTSFL